MSRVGAPYAPRMRATICAISGNQCARYHASSSSGRRVARRSYVGKAVGEAWELVESHEARGSVRDMYAVVDLVLAAAV